MWTNYDPDVVRRELAVLHDHGLDLTRSFFYWPDFMPAPDRVDEVLVGHYQDFLDAHVEQQMRTIPTFIVGHMSGENWDPAWRDGRDLYSDVWLVGRQAWFARTMTARFCEHPSVAGWLISNEMPIYGGEAPTAIVSAWAELMVQAVRAGGGTQPVSLGDGAWGIEVTGVDNGYSVRQIAPMVDFVGPHVYPMGTDVVRQHLRAALACELAAVAGRPVVLEEFGLSSDFASAASSAHYYRQVLHTTLLAGATGWIAWNNTDYDDLVGQDPYRHHPFELHFGITDSEGAPKPPLLELAAFRSVLDAVDLGACERTPAHAALVVSSYLESDYPLADELDRAFVFAGLEQAHVAAREADLPLALVRESDGIVDGYALYLVPSTKQLTGPSWLRLQELAVAGATVWVSYGVGESVFQRGPWWTNTLNLFGVRNDLVYGLNDPIEDDELVLTFVAPLGDIDAGESLTFAVGGGPNARAFLPVEVVDAQVVAVDGRGRPAIVRKRHGAGQAVLCTYPLEYLAATRARVNPESTTRIYSALASEADAHGPVTVPDPRVLVDSLVHRDGRTFVWLVSESDEELKAEPESATGRSLEPIGGGDPVDVVTLAPYGVTVLQIATPADVPTKENR